LKLLSQWTVAKVYELAILLINYEKKLKDTVTQLHIKFDTLGFWLVLNNLNRK